MCASEVKKETPNHPKPATDVAGVKLPPKGSSSSFLRLSTAPTSIPHPPPPAGERGKLQPARHGAEAGPLLQAAAGLSHPGKTSPTALISHVFSHLSHRRHLNSVKVTIRRGFCCHWDIRAEFHTATGAQPSSSQPWGSEWLAQLYAAGPTPCVCWKFSRFSLLERAGSQVSLGFHQCPSPCSSRERCPGRCVPLGCCSVSHTCSCGSAGTSRQGMLSSLARLRSDVRSQNPAQLRKAAAFSHQ